ncbi:hypothetical protein [Streptosporangium sp. NPDC002524]|uniref:hypothetical protein n=1 Tax=Streptosporangium sp. NPDC002524 TaxID=3154537 RepID=UPI00332CBB2F
MIKPWTPDELAYADAVFGRLLGRRLGGAADDPALGYPRDDYAEHLRTEYSTFGWLPEPMPGPMLDAAGFGIVEAEFRQSIYGARTCVRR